MPCSRGGVLSQQALQQGGSACSGGLLPGGTCSGGGACRPPRKQTATVADGTHPTGMHSCYALFMKILFIIRLDYNVLGLNLSTV